MRVLVGLASLGLLLGASLACTRPSLQTTRGLDFTLAEPFVLHRWSFDPAPHLATPASPSPIQATTPHDRFLAVHGRWRVEADAAAPSAPHVMSQEQATSVPARILVERLAFEGVSVRAKCRPDDAAATCGVIFGARDESDYFVARVEPSARAVQLSRVVGAVEIPLGVSHVEVAAHEWHEIAVWTRAGDTFVSVDGAVAFSAKLDDASPTGRVGLFAEGKASFDDLGAMSLESRSAAH
ncbi:MAG: hypothetical protein HYV09_32540 [Deltaproteobacteria bacterium]|nr:hypothetical protein [Deltaproteobacteria bacterium]